MLRCCFHVERNAKRWQRDSEMPQRRARGRNELWEKYMDTHCTHRHTHTLCMEGDAAHARTRVYECPEFRWKYLEHCLFQRMRRMHMCSEIKCKYAF